MALEKIADPDEMRRVVRGWHADGLSVGLVPTMGALHEGHLSLIRASAAECDRTVVSIFVNPTQFAPGEDLASYPRSLDGDCASAARAGADVVFCPSDRAMYPDGYATYVMQERLTGVLEGRSRPTHFRGVLTVVCKLLNIAPADRAYFGRKDFQQTVVVRRMVRDLNLPSEIRILPTVRESDGLAMSSRNVYLSAEERTQALCLVHALRRARGLFESGETDADALRAAMREVLDEQPLARTDYADIVNADTLEPVRTVTRDDVAVLAVRVGGTRLIDNMPMADDTPADPLSS
ncbi:MAG: pantoate--beta-alanine ligase [Candidatus Brocadiaceae bacterium]|nr:pantoate--beta-alanine ligase [Candidatus Brocadiaceae bacterium]